MPAARHTSADMTPAVAVAEISVPVAIAPGRIVRAAGVDVGVDRRAVQDFALGDQPISRVGDHLEGVTGGAVGDDS